MQTYAFVCGMYADIYLNIVELNVANLQNSISYQKNFLTLLYIICEQSTVEPP